MDSASESPIPPPIESSLLEQSVSVDSAKTAASDSARSPTEVLGPMQGGRWRPVRPDELLRKNAAAPNPDPVAETPKVRLERRQELEQHLKLRPTDLDAFLELSRLYRSEDRPIDAKRVLQQATQIFPSEERLTWEMEEATLARSRQQLREVTDLASRLSTPEVTQALQRSQTDWSCRRMEVCRARLARDPQQRHLHLVLAEAMFDSGMFEATIEELQTIIDTDDYSPQANLLVARSLIAMGKDLDAMPKLRAASMRRVLPAPLRIRIIALRLLCEIAERLGTTMTLERYRQHLAQAEQELVKSS